MTTSKSDIVFDIGDTVRYYCNIRPHTATVKIKFKIRSLVDNCIVIKSTQPPSTPSNRIYNELYTPKNNRKYSPLEPIAFIRATGRATSGLCKVAHISMVLTERYYVRE